MNKITIGDAETDRIAAKNNGITAVGVLCVGNYILDSAARTLRDSGIFSGNSGSLMIHIIWDLDGTLVDTQAEMLYHLNLALQDVSVDIRDQVKPIRTGPPLDIILKESFPAETLTTEKINEVIYRYRERYDNSGFKMTDSFDGIDEIVSDTVNFVHHLVTNKPNPAAQRIVEKLGWTDKIASIKALSAHIEQRKSKTDRFTELIAEFGGDRSSFIGIGDAKTDCIAAKNNGIAAVGVLWGSGTREEMADCCDYLFEDTRQLHDFLYER